MNKHIVTAVASFVMGGIATGVFLAQAQPAGPGQPPMPMQAPPGAAWGPGGRPGPMGPWAEQMHDRMQRRGEAMRAFALLYHTDDRKITPDDAKKIAEGLLLWRGNHSWKVTNVAPEGDAIGFDFATAEGAVIAHFTMDPKTARVKRVG